MSLSHCLFSVSHSYLIELWTVRVKCNYSATSSWFYSVARSNSERNFFKCQRSRRRRAVLQHARIKVWKDSWGQKDLNLFNKNQVSDTVRDLSLSKRKTRSQLEEEWIILKCDSLKVVSGKWTLVQYDWCETAAILCPSEADGVWVWWTLARLTCRDCWTLLLLWR